ncbi:hypothetical protein [Streptomyces sp. NPDC002276]
MKQVLRKAELLLLAAALKAERALGMGARYGPPAPIAVRVTSRPLRSGAALAVPLAALGGSTFGAFSDGTRFLQAVWLGVGMTLFFALLMRLERLSQLHYERVGYAPATRPFVHRPRAGGPGRTLARLSTRWVVLTMVFWGVERAKGAPVSWLFSGVAMALVLLVIVAISYLAERRARRSRPPTG